MAQDLGSLRDLTALLVIRVRMERGSALPLRAYIRTTSDVSLGFEHSSVVADVDPALAIVRAWLEQASDAGPLHDVATVPPLWGAAEATDTP